jgi:hypothetical protein
MAAFWVAVDIRNVKTFVLWKNPWSWESAAQAVKRAISWKRSRDGASSSMAATGIRSAILPHGTDPSQKNALSAESPYYWKR